MKQRIWKTGAAALLFLVGIRIVWINSNVKAPVVKTYSEQEEVSIRNNIFTDDSENMNGYMVKVIDTEILSYDAYLEKYHYKEDPGQPLVEPDDTMLPEMIYEISIEVRNRNETDDVDSGIDFFNYKLIDTDFSLSVDRPLYAIANPDMEDGSLCVHLNPGTNQIFHLPFLFSPSSEDISITEQDIKNAGMYLVVSRYPEQQRIYVTAF